MELIRLKEWQKLSIGANGDISEPDARRVHALADRMSRRLPRKPAVMTRTAEPALRMGQVIGVLATPGVTVEILPKIDTENDTNLRRSLVRMLAVAKGLPIADDELAQLDTQPDNLLEILIRIFANRLLVAIRHGLPHRYIGTEDDLPRLKGKLDAKRQFSRNAVRPDRLACKFDEFSSDTPLNRVLKATVERLIKLSNSAPNQRMLAELLSRFDAVSDSPYPLRERVMLDQTNRTFHQLYVLAKLLLSGDWQSTTTGKTEGFSLLFPMNELFEEFVGRCLQIKLSTNRVKLQPRAHYAITQSAEPYNLFQLNPDIVVDGNIIVDTKWKELKPGESKAGVKQEDIYQLLAYARAYNAKRIILLYPWHRGLDSQPGIYCHWHTAGESIPFDIATVDVSKPTIEIRDTLGKIINLRDSESEKSLISPFQGEPVQDLQINFAPDKIAELKKDSRQTRILERKAK